jgi:hypothetical protein
MKVTLKAGDQVLGTADLEHLPGLGTIILLPTGGGGPTQARSVDKIEDDPSGGKIISVGGARPTFDFPR